MTRQHRKRHSRASTSSSRFSVFCSPCDVPPRALAMVRVDVPAPLTTDPLSSNNVMGVCPGEQRALAMRCQLQHDPMDYQHQ